MENKFDLLPYFLVFIRRRRVILINFIFILIIAVINAFVLTKKEFKAEIVFLPPSNENSLEGMLPSGLMLPSLSSSDIMPEQIQTIFESKALRRKIIDKFNLFEHYKLMKNINKFEFALKTLNKEITLSTEEKGSMAFSKTISYNLKVFHSSPDTVCQMANYTFELLDSTVQAISVDQAHRNRLFIEKQLDKNKRILDSVNNRMQDFQLHFKAYDITEQAKMSIAAYAQLKSAMRINEIQMQAVHQEFSTETPELNALRKTNEAYQAQLSQLETRETPDALPSLQSATKLLPRYTNLLRDIEVQNQVILLLTRELEQAKIKEDKNVSSLFIVDPAYVPAYKARPKRMTILAIWIATYMVFILLYILLMEVYKIQLKESKLLRSIKDAYAKKEKKIN
jgi:uncharacterized protein involved in exopolysaccharide biosynthesis